MSRSLRLAEAVDVRAMHRIRLAVRENVLTTNAVDEAAYLPRLGEIGLSWVAIEDGLIVGFAAAERSGSIWALFVDPEHEGRGHGRALHDTMLAWLREQGVERAFLDTEPGTRAERFYRRSGWTPCGPAANGDLGFELVL